MPQRQTAQFLALHGLNSVNDFNLIKPHQAKDMVKASSARHPAQAMGILIQNNLTGLIWYVKDRARRGLPVYANNILLDDLHRGHMAYEAYIQNRDKGENIKALEKWCDKYDFDDWDCKVTETLSLVYGHNYCPIAYVIRPDKLAGWDPAVNAVNDYERLMYQLPLNGIAFKQDNETVFSFIQLAMVHSQAETWIYDHVPGRDGHGAMQALRNHYEGEAELDVQASKAQQVLDTLVYMNEKQMRFEAMITKLNKAYNALKRQGQEFTERSKVEQLAKRIKNPSRDIQITVAIKTMREVHKADYTAAMQYITARMAQINSASVNAPGATTRCISEFSSADMAQNKWNGVNIHDPWRKFTDNEWFTKLGDCRQELIRAKCRHNSSRGHGGHGYGGRGCGGHGCNRGWNNNGGRGGQSQNNEWSVNETATGDHATAPAQGTGGNIPSIMSTASQSQASSGVGNDRGGQNGNRFGTNRP